MNGVPADRIAVLTGGKSREREISLRSGAAVVQALRSLGFQVDEVDTGSAQGLDYLESHRPDFAFVTLHGRGGEDGEIQRLLDGRGIPYLGSDAEASGRAFDKIRAKELFVEAGVPTPRYRVITLFDWREKANELGYPLFVKPPEEGSSLDVRLVENRAAAEMQIPDLCCKYPLLLAEKKVCGREMTVGILGHKPLPVVEIRPHRPFYDYEAKYQSCETEYLVPAPIDIDVAVQAQAIGLKVHQVLGLRDFSRVDMIAGEWGLEVLEANTIPGFTATSLLPKAAKAAGLEFPNLCVELIKIAFERLNHEKAKKESILAS